MMQQPNIAGTGTALVTPFTPDGAVDYPALEKLIQYQVSHGVDFLVALGTTGEAVTLSREEKEQVISLFKHHKREASLVVGIGGNNTQLVCEQIRHTDFEGIDAILSVVPYYNKPGQEGMFLHFSAIAASSPVPVILYNVPGRTGSNMTADTTLRLAEAHENIIAVKEASGNMDQMMAILRRRPDGFSLFSGDDALTFPLLTLGADGVISVVSNAYPALVASMVAAARSGDLHRARKIHERLLPFTEMLFREGSPAGVKEALKAMGLGEAFVRLPLSPVSEELKRKIITFVTEKEIPLT